MLDHEKKFLQLLERVHLMMDDHQDALVRLRELERDIREALVIVKGSGV